MALKVGNHVFYLNHGVAEVTGKEVQELGGQEHEMYVLELFGGGRLLLPLNGLEDQDMRDLVSESKAKKLMTKIRRKEELPEKVDWKTRSAEHTDMLKEGKPDDYAEVLKELLLKSRFAKLTVADEKNLELSKRYFLGEISTVLGLSLEKLHQTLSNVVNKE